MRLGARRDDAVAQLLRTLGPQARVALVRGPQPPRRSVRRALRGWSVSTVDATLTPDALHRALAADGPYDLLVDATGGGRRRARRLPRLVLHVRPRGALVVLDASSTIGPVARVVATLEGADADGSARIRRRRAVRGVPPAVASVERGPRDVVLHRSALVAWPSLRDAEVTAALALPGRPSGEVLAELPAERRATRCEVVESPSPRAGRKAAEIGGPPMSLRAYDDVVVAPGHLARQGDLVLPDSFRRPYRRRMRSTRLIRVGDRFVRPREPLAEPVPLAGAYYYLDTEFRGHYGHLLTEQLSRLWGWEQARAADPSLRVLLGTAADGSLASLAPYERDLLAAAGVAEAEVTIVDRPVRVDRLVSATPMFAQPSVAHPALPATWAGVGAALDASATGGPYPARIFCARRSEKRACRNAIDVEALFAAHGFAVVFPEDLPLAEQVRLFRGADVVAGYAGAAMFTLALCERPTSVVLVSSESYTAENEYLIAALLGHRLCVAWCRPEVAMPVEGFSGAAYRSAYWFDTDREGVWLEQVLADLPSR